MNYPTSKFVPTLCPQLLLSYSKWLALSKSKILKKNIFCWGGSKNKHLEHQESVTSIHKCYKTAFFANWKASSRGYSGALTENRLKTGPTQKLLFMSSNRPLLNIFFCVWHNCSYECHYNESRASRFLNFVPSIQKS